MKKTLSFSIFFAAIVCGAVLAFAQNNQQESLTITTYYPAPHGVYRQLRSNAMVVGSPGAPTDFPTFPGAFRFKPVTNPPAANTQPIGTIYFDDTAKAFKYYNGTGDWQLLGGTGSAPQSGLAGYVKITGYYSQLPIYDVETCDTVMAPGLCTQVWSQPGVSAQCTASCQPGWISLLLNSDTQNIAGGSRTWQEYYTCFKQ